jgi:hypothetical protein
MSAKPIGTMRKLVSLVDRGAFDDIVYPTNETSTLLQPDFKHYHNFTTGISIWPFRGVAEWGKRITFEVPWPWEVDMLSWIALRIKPFHWFSSETYRLLYKTQDLTWRYPNQEWMWANSLGTCAVQRVEMEVDGVIVEQWSGDWCSVWSRIAKDMNQGIGWDDSLTGPLGGTTDGYIYCYLPFWFAKWINTSYPLLSSKGPLRFHITLRPFHEVVRKRGEDKTCDETPLGKSFEVRDWRFPYINHVRIQSELATPTMEVAELVCGTAHIDGDLRKAFTSQPHEMLTSPVQEIPFAEPLKYTVGIPSGGIINIGLPIVTNGPVRQLLWFLRRKDVALRSDWNNYSAVLENEVDPTWNPIRPLLRRAQLLVGTAIWADEEEAWWRSQGALPLAGGIRAYGNFVYAYNFTETPNKFSPGGSLNASRVDIRLNLEVEQPTSGGNNEWEVVVFVVGTNWLRFQNGLANELFQD